MGCQLWSNLIEGCPCVRMKSSLIKHKFWTSHDFTGRPGNDLTLESETWGIKTYPVCLLYNPSWGLAENTCSYSSCCSVSVHCSICQPGALYVRLVWSVCLSVNLSVISVFMSVWSIYLPNLCLYSAAIYVRHLIDTLLIQNKPN